MCVSTLEVTLNTDRALLSLEGKGITVGLCWQPALEVDGRLLKLGDANSVIVEGVSASGRMIAGKTVNLCASFIEAGIRWTVQLRLADRRRSLLMSMVVQNTGDRLRKLGKCCLVHTAREHGFVRIGDGTPDIVFIEFTGDQRLNQVNGLRDDTRLFCSRHIAHLHDRTTGQTLHLGFVTLDRIHTEHSFACDAAGRVTQLESYCDFLGYALQPMSSVKSEKLVIEASTNALVSLERWADRVNREYRPSLPSRPPAGWVGWSWVDGFNVELFESVVLRNAQALRRRLPGHDFDYIWVSIGNIAGGFPGNWLEFNTTSFPQGVDNLVSQLAGLGLKLGFWVAPFWICSALQDKVEELRDCLLRDEEGELLVTCKQWNYGDAAALPKEKRPGCYALDASHPRTLEFLRHVFTTYRQWGIRYYMIDFLHAGFGVAPYGFPYGDYHDHALIKGPQVYRNALQTVREAAGPDTYLLCSTGPTMLNVGIVNAARTGNDYGEGRALHPDTYFYPATFVINGPGFWTSHKYATTNMAANYFTHRKLYLNDSGNVMTVDKPIPLCEAQITATIFGINGGPMMLGDDIDRISEERLNLIRKCLPRGGECAFPVDLFDRPAPDYPRVFHLRIAPDWDIWDIVAVFNYDDTPQTHTLDFTRIQLDAKESYVVWEFWNEQYLGAHTSSVDVCVPPRSARVLRIQRKRDHPWLLSTDMHVRQGQYEVLSCTWDRDSLTLKGEVTRPAGEVGDLFFTVPCGLSLANPRGLWIAKDANDQTLIVRAQLNFGDAPASFALRFAPIKSQ